MKNFKLLYDKFAKTLIKAKFKNRTIASFTLVFITSNEVTVDELLKNEILIPEYSTTLDISESKRKMVEDGGLLLYKKLLYRKINYEK